MKHKIIVATNNVNKIREIRVVLEDLGYEVLSMTDAGINLDIVEDGLTYADNAEIKAKAVWAYTGNIVLAEDSGFEVDYIDGEPGIYSARYMGKNTSYDIKNRNIIDRLKDAPENSRTARFICNIAVVMPDGQIFHTEDSIDGVITHEPASNEGFGYDPILLIPEYGVTLAELTIEQKNRISHRGKALVAMNNIIRNALQIQNKG